MHSRYRIADDELQIGFKTYMAYVWRFINFEQGFCVCDLLDVFIPVVFSPPLPPIATRFPPSSLVSSRIKYLPSSVGRQTCLY